MARHVFTDTVSYAVTDGPAGDPWELTPARIWDRRRGELGPPNSLGSIVAHTGGAGNGWREITRDEAPEALRALIDAAP